MGAIDLIGCVTNVTEYNRAVTMPNKITVTATTTKAQMRTSSSAVSSSTDRGWLGSWFGLLNLLLQNWGNKVLGTSLRKLAARLLAPLSMEIVWVLAEVAVLLVAAHQQDQGQYQFPHFYFRM
jgi:hypothetical protein